MNVRSLLGLVLMLVCQSALGDFRAGATVVDVTPRTLPALVNGGMLSRSIDTVKTPLNARALVLDDGEERLAIVVVDSCMMPRPLLDEAKQEAAAKTGIKADHILISATHTHTAASCMGALGTSADPDYPLYLVDKLVEAIVAAEQNLEPAEVGWGLRSAADFTALRRWIRRPDRIAEDPFGNLTVRANMHAGRNWDDVTGESGPEDPDLTLIAVRGRDGKALAVLSNFSMHYFGDRDISADYFGLFCEGMKQRLVEAGQAGEGFVGMLSHGCSGDIWRRDYKLETQPDPKIEEYAEGLLDIAMQALGEVTYRSDVTLDMAEQRMQLSYRLPDKQRLEWAQRIVDAMGDREPKTTEEVYAREQILLHERQSTEIVVQGIRIGEIAIATTPNETYALTGLKIKKQSPLTQTMVIELANGGDGYIPPPEQHVLGGYNTWAARSAGLEVQAEPKIAETAIELLEQVTGSHRRTYRQPVGTVAKQTLQLNPVAYWRCDEFAGPEAVDSSGHGRHAIYETGTVFFLDGPKSEMLTAPEDFNRCVHLAGGRMRANLDGIDADYSISLWCWNGMPVDARGTTGWLISRGRDHRLDAFGEHLGLAGNGEHAGKLILRQGNSEVNLAIGKTVLPRWTWHHVALVRRGDQLQVHVDGALDLEVAAKPLHQAEYPLFLFGGRGDRVENWEGRLDEVSVFDRALTAEEIQRLVP
ncbi:MAG: hypothetical protein KDA58_04530 [Planctomycetaceae bacterium]|nr:hypothetical protein [Planctomycetaceae bacterium]